MPEGFPEQGGVNGLGENIYGNPDRSWIHHAINDQLVDSSNGPSSDIHIVRPDLPYRIPEQFTPLSVYEIDLVRSEAEKAGVSLPEDDSKLQQFIADIDFETFIH